MLDLGMLFPRGVRVLQLDGSRLEAIRRILFGLA